MAGRETPIPKGSVFHRRSRIHRALFTHRSQTPQRSFQGAAAGTHATPAPNRAHSGSHGETRGLSLHRPQQGFVLSAKLPPKEQPEKVDARLMACVRFLRRRGPAGLRSLDAVVSAAASVSALLSLCLQFHHRPLPLFRFLSKLLCVVVETHTSLLLTVLLHLPQSAPPAPPR